MDYVISACPRSGSSLLAECLSEMKIGNPGEHLNPALVKRHEWKRREQFMQPTPWEYMQRIRQECTIDGIYGIKIQYRQFERFPDIINNPDKYFPNAKYISITRNNILRQAVSSLRSEQTNAWRYNMPERRKPSYNYLLIVKNLILLARDIENWEKFYAKHNIQPLRIYYEDLESNYEATIRKVIAYLGVSGDIPAPPLKKQANAETQQWLERFCNTYYGENIGDLLSRIKKKFALRKKP